MKKIILSLVVILISFFNVSNANEIIEYYQSGKIKTKTIISSEGKDFKYIMYFENGDIKIDSKFVNNKEKAWIKEYYESGMLYAESYLENDAPIKDVSYYQNGNVMAEIAYNKEKKIYIRKRYYDTGELAFLVEIPVWGQYAGTRIRSYSKDENILYRIDVLNENYDVDAVIYRANSKRQLKARTNNHKLTSYTFYDVEGNMMEGHPNLEKEAQIYITNMINDLKLAK